MRTPVHTNHLIALGLAAGLAAATGGTASAAFTGVSVQDLGNVTGDGFSSTYQVFLEFDDPADVVLGLFGTAETPLSYATLSGDGTLLLAGDDIAQPGSLPGASWLTIGLADDLSFSPGFGGGAPGPYFVGDAWSYDGGGIFDENLSTPITGGSVIVAQFTIDAGAVVQFAGNVAWTPAGGGGPSESPFSVVIPGPGAAALLGLAGLLGAGRRRR